VRAPPRVARSDSPSSRIRAAEDQNLRDGPSFRFETSASIALTVRAKTAGVFACACLAASISRGSSTSRSGRTIRPYRSPTSPPPTARRRMPWVGPPLCRWRGGGRRRAGSHSVGEPDRCARRRRGLGEGPPLHDVGYGSRLLGSASGTLRDARPLRGLRGFVGVIAPAAVRLRISSRGSAACGESEYRSRHGRRGRSTLQRPVRLGADVGERAPLAAIRAVAGHTATIPVGGLARSAVGVARDPPSADAVGDGPALLKTRDVARVALGLRVVLGRGGRFERRIARLKRSVHPRVDVVAEFLLAARAKTVGCRRIAFERGFGLRSATGRFRRGVRRRTRDERDSDGCDGSATRHERRLSSQSRTGQEPRGRSHAHDDRRAPSMRFAEVATSRRVTARLTTSRERPPSPAAGCRPRSHSDSSVASSRSITRLAARRTFAVASTSESKIG